MVSAQPNDCTVSMCHTVWHITERTHHMSKLLEAKLTTLAETAAQQDWEDSLPIWTEIVELLGPHTGTERFTYESCVTFGYRTGRAADLGIDYYDQPTIALEKIPGYCAAVKATS
jgi:hypothetical protein